MRIKIALSVVALFVAVLAAPASGGTPPTLTVTPTSGPVGTDFTVSGDQCFPSEGPNAFGSWVIFAQGSDTGLAAGGGSSLESGVWQDGFPTAPPEVSFLPGPGTYVVEADCSIDEEIEFSYEPATFTLTEAPPTSPTTEESTTTTAAAPAAAAAAAPSFTG
jgi:hypothetical protein